MSPLTASNPVSMALPTDAAEGSRCDAAGDLAGPPAHGAVAARGAERLPASPILAAAEVHYGDGHADHSDHRGGGAYRNHAAPPPGPARPDAAPARHGPDHGRSR